VYDVSVCVCACVCVSLCVCASELVSELVSVCVCVCALSVHVHATIFQLSRQLAVALQHEELRHAHLTYQLRIMSQTLDKCNKDARVESSDHVINVLLGVCGLSRTLMGVYASLCSDGRVQVRVSVCV